MMVVAQAVDGDEENGMGAEREEEGIGTHIWTESEKRE